MRTRCASDDLDALQSCICTSSPVHKEVEASLTRDVRSSCSNDEDRSSADVVLSQYCNPSSTYTFSTPTDNIVQAYITEISEMEYLPPCAQSALSEAVMGVSHPSLITTVSYFANRTNRLVTIAHLMPLFTTPVSAARTTSSLVSAQRSPRPSSTHAPTKRTSLPHRTSTMSFAP